MKSYFDKILFSKTRDVKSPVRANPTDAGLDFFVPDDMLWESFTLVCNQHILIDSGIKMNVPAGYVLISLEKSGIATKGLIIGAKVVDAGYQGNIHIHLIAVAKEGYTIRRGQKIAQFVLLPIETPTPVEVPEAELFTAKSNRGEGGFGSTGL
jgi:dUTP pyrophosphatase